ncbi:MAG TPA: hypothetical protein VFV58_30745 [Blastocatellia bacterium]|jgi:hypothetical protein|nr:hypothetical protein [Blastocatellia bacterium]
MCGDGAACRCPDQGVNFSLRFLSLRFQACRGDLWKMPAIVAAAVGFRDLGILSNPRFRSVLSHLIYCCELKELYARNKRPGIPILQTPDFVKLFQGRMEFSGWTGNCWSWNYFSGLLELA